MWNLKSKLTHSLTVTILIMAVSGYFLCLMNGLCLDVIDALLFMVSPSQTLYSTLSFNKSRVGWDADCREGAQRVCWLTFIHLYYTPHTRLTPRLTQRRNTKYIRFTKKLTGNINIHCQEKCSLSTWIFNHSSVFLQNFKFKSESQ